MTPQQALTLQPNGASKERTAREWKSVVQTYQVPSVSRSTIELVVTIVPFMVLWAAAAWATLSVSYWLALAFIVPASLFLLRLFLIQHDCGHQALFKTSRTNDRVGRALGILTMTPYDVWRRSHAIHHACSGNLDRRGTGDIMTLTIAEYRALPAWKKFQYYLYRHPAVMFGVGPAYVFLLAHRWPMGQMREGWTPWLSAMGTNVMLAAAFGTMIYAVGLNTFLAVHLPIVLIAATIGVWLFYVQHQFEDTIWEETRHWTHEEAALYGSSFYDLPPVVSWFTANIGIHHVHHLYSRIPFYRLPEVLRDHPQLANMRRITTMEGIRTLRLKLWDPDSKRLVSFAEARRLPTPAMPALMAAE